MNTPCRGKLVLWLVLLGLLPGRPDQTRAQEKSVQPGINKQFENPNPAEFIERFEREGREVFDKRVGVVAACKIKKGTAVADIGAGTGLFTRMISPIVGSEGRVYAVDISKRFIELIDRTCREQGLKNVTGVECTAASVELPADSIDLAFICDTYHHFEFPEKTMQSIHKALRPGGQLILVEFSRTEGVSSNWILDHVRAGQETFTSEIEATGFEFVEEVDIFKESYFLRFKKLPTSATRSTEKRPAAANPLRGKRVIEWGWDEPDTKFIRENIDRMEQLPFDGFVFHANTDQGVNPVWEIWGSRKFEISEFGQAIRDLRATEFHRLNDRFLRVNVTPGTVDWFDDDAWPTVLNNFEVVAKIARQGLTKGFMFDVEQYNSALFDFRQQKHRDSRSFAEYQAQVRERGRQWMRTVNKEFPDITILLTFGYSITRPKGESKDRSESHYGLLADFLDGLLDACSDRTTIVDAWESSYPNKRHEQFVKAYDTIREQSVAWTANPEKYRRHVRAGFGIWMDYNWRKFGWDLADFSKNHLTPAEFEYSVHSALRTSDAYVWVYTEQPRWWTNERLPSAYVEALRKAPAPHDIDDSIKRR